MFFSTFNNIIINIHTQTPTPVREGIVKKKYGNEYESKLKLRSDIFNKYTTMGAVCILEYVSIKGERKQADHICHRTRVKIEKN